MNLPVVAVVATAGEDRLVLLTERALPSIARQTSQVDLVVVVSDNDPLSDHLEEDDVTRCFGVGSNVRLLLNSRTRGNSGTGAWNTGIYAALEAFGEDCWVAILDDDDEWKENHIELCLCAANEKSQWIASGLIRCSPSGRKNETFPTSKPSAEDFFAANPGVQGSNLFVRVGSLLGAGLFDEALPSTTDRDLCIRLCDLLEGSDDWYSHTAEHTVIHYADDDRARVSSRGSTAKILGLKRFYYKYAARMSANQRKEFKDRAANLFDCGEEEFNAVENWVGSAMKLETWSGDTLPLNNGTVEALPKLQAAAPPGRDKDRTVVFGLITSNMFRIVPLLNDLSTASRCGAFDPFIVIFVNSVKEELTTSIESELKKRKVQFYLLSRMNRVVNSILKLCNDTEMPPDEEQLPIAMSRTVLQVFIHQNILPLAESKRFDRIIDAVVIMDDDKRLPKGWSPFARSDADIAIGRDLRTPPNPSIFSLRTNLIDFIYNLDLAHMKGADQDEVRSYCLTQTPFDSKFDWYYDLSSSRMDHLEQPVYQANAQLDSCPLGRLLNDFLVGTPLCRDVLPLESGPTEQRGGCMVIMNRDGKSFEPLAVQQHAPLITFSDGKTSSTRRSDTFWIKQMKSRGLSICVDEHLYVYHDNQFDTVPSPSNIRKNVVQEVIGGILCRDSKWRNAYKASRVLELRTWLARVNGILVSLQNRPYCNDEMVQRLISPLREIMDTGGWENEVFEVIQRSFTPLEEYEPAPFDFVRALDVFPNFDDAGVKTIQRGWGNTRITLAHRLLLEATGKDGSYVGAGLEGVCFRVDEELFKIFDKAPSSIPPQHTIQLLDCRYLDCSPPILQRRYYPGYSYRGGHGLALVNMLRQWRSKNLYHKNLSPDNLIVNSEEETVTVVDIGKDVKLEKSNAVYEKCFRDMCKRAFLSFRFGQRASNPHALGHLKQWMRDDFSSLRLVGFETFMRVVLNSANELLEDRLKQLKAVCGCIIASNNSVSDDEVLGTITEAIARSRASTTCSRVAVAIQDPFSQGLDDMCRSLGFYRRHLRRFLASPPPSSLEEDSIVLINEHSFQEYVGFHIFILDLESTLRVDRSPALLSNGCVLMLKSCPLEHQTILSDVRRTVHSLEAHTSFKSIVLVADVSKTDGFLRQYASVDVVAYETALKQIKAERLVDHIVEFDGRKAPLVRDLNSRWLGIPNCQSTHSVKGQHYASTFVAFDFIKDLNCYCEDDIILQMDSDMIVHCDDENGIVECISRFEEDQGLVSFAFPIASSRTSAHHHTSQKHDNTPCRFEIRCSFVHLGRLVSMLPLVIPSNEKSEEGLESPLERGWWRTLDHNIRNHNLKSCRGSVGVGNNIFFIHPPNEFKHIAKITKLSLVSDILSSQHTSVVDLKKKSPWEKQLGCVNLCSVSNEWLRERHEPVVVAINLSNASYGNAILSFESLERTRDTRKMFRGCGIILFDNGSANWECMCCKLFSMGSQVFGRSNLSTISWRKQLSTSAVQIAIRSMCTEPNAVIFILRGDGSADLRNAQCLLPAKPMKLCNECGGFDDRNCQCCLDVATELDCIPHTTLPTCVPSLDGSGMVTLENTKFFASETITEGQLDIQVTALVNRLENISGAESVCVRIHSECLTGDVFYSMKCDCGQEKLQFIRNTMVEEDNRSRPSVLVYIKGHEGRGSGIYSKVKAYKWVEQNPTNNHIDALRAVGCESDTRSYDAAMKFLKRQLKVKSIRLFTNNPEKIAAAKKYFGSSNCSHEPMPAEPSSHNEKYLKEKKELLGHNGLLSNLHATPRGSQ